MHNHYGRETAQDLQVGDYVTVKNIEGTPYELKVIDKSSTGVTGERTNKGVITLDFDKLYSARRETLTQEQTEFGYAIVKKSVPITATGKPTSYAIVRAQQGAIWTTGGSDVKPLPRQRLCKILHIEAETIVRNSEKAKSIVQVMFQLANHFSVRQDTYEYYRIYRYRINGQLLKPWPNEAKQELSVAAALQLQCTGNDCKSEMQALCDALDLFCADALTPDEKYGLSRALAKDVGRQFLLTTLRNAAFHAIFNRCGSQFSEARRLSTTGALSAPYVTAFGSMTNTALGSGWGSVAHSFWQPRNAEPLALNNLPWWASSALNPMTEGECRGVSGVVVDSVYSQAHEALKAFLSAESRQYILGAYKALHQYISVVISTVEQLTVPLLVGCVTGYMVYNYVRYGKPYSDAETCVKVDKELKEFNNNVKDIETVYKQQINEIRDRYGEHNQKEAELRAKHYAKNMYVNQLYDAKQTRDELKKMHCRSHREGLVSALVVGTASAGAVHQLGLIISFGALTSMSLTMLTVLIMIAQIGVSMSGSIPSVGQFFRDVLSNKYVKPFSTAYSWATSAKVKKIRKWLRVVPTIGNSKTPSVFGAAAFMIFGAPSNNSRSSLHAARQTTAALMKTNPHLAATACRNWSALDTKTLFKIANDLRIDVNSQMSGKEICDRIASAYPDQYLFIGSPAVKRLRVLNSASSEQRAVKMARIATMLSNVGLLHYIVRWLLWNPVQGECLGEANLFGFASMLYYVNTGIKSLFGLQYIANNEINTETAAKKTFYDNVLTRSSDAQALATSEYPLMNPKEALKLAETFTAMRRNVDKSTPLDLTALKQAIGSDDPGDRKLRLIRRLLVLSLGPHKSIARIFHADTGTAYSLDNIMNMTTADITKGRTRPVDDDSTIGQLLARAGNRNVALGADSRPTSKLSDQSVYTGSSADINRIEALTSTLKGISDDRLPQGLDATFEGAAQNNRLPNIHTVIPDTLKSKSVLQRVLTINALCRLGYNFRTLGVQMRLVTVNGSVQMHSLPDLHKKFNVSLHGVTTRSVPKSFVDSNIELLKYVGELQGLIPLGNDTTSSWRSWTNIKGLWSDEYLQATTDLPYELRETYRQCYIHQEFLKSMTQLALQQLPGPLKTEDNALVVSCRWMTNLRGMFVAAAKNLDKKQQLLVHCDRIDQIVLRNVRWDSRHPQDFLMPVQAQWTLTNPIVTNSKTEVQFALVQDGSRILQTVKYVDTIPFVDMSTVNSGSHISSHPAGIDARTNTATSLPGYRLDPDRQQRIRDLNEIIANADELLSTLSEKDEFDALGALIETSSWSCAQKLMSSREYSSSANDELLENETGDTFYEIHNNRGIVILPNEDPNNNAVRLLYLPSGANAQNTIYRFTDDESSISTKLRDAKKIWAYCNASEHTMNAMGRIMQNDYGLTLVHTMLSSSTRNTENRIAVHRTLVDALYSDLDKAEEYCKKEQEVKSQNYPFQVLKQDVASRIRDSEWVKHCSALIGANPKPDITYVRQLLLSNTSKRQSNILFFMRPDGTLRDSASEICYAMSVYGDTDVCNELLNHKTFTEDANVTSLLPSQIRKWVSGKD